MVYCQICGGRGFCHGANLQNIYKTKATLYFLVIVAGRTWQKINIVLKINHLTKQLSYMAFINP